MTQERSLVVRQRLAPLGKFLGKFLNLLGAHRVGHRISLLVPEFVQSWRRISTATRAKKSNKMPIRKHPTAAANSPRRTHARSLRNDRVDAWLRRSYFNWFPSFLDLTVAEPNRRSDVRVRPSHQRRELVNPFVLNLKPTDGVTVWFIKFGCQSDAHSNQGTYRKALEGVACGSMHSRPDRGAALRAIQQIHTHETECPFTGDVYSRLHDLMHGFHRKQRKCNDRRLSGIDSEFGFTY